ncbi:MAG: 3'(2'),5'-bisphosphate nucleotidase CysQ [Alsobacter sp.]
MPLASPDIPARVTAAARDAAREAGQLALGWFREGADTAAAVNFKAGGSPVTEADLAVDAFLRDRLMAAAPDFGWLSEETADTRARLDHRTVWIVDPIDGTRAFARGGVDWTVVIGIVVDGRPVAGFVHVPVTGEMFEVAPGDVSRLNGRPIAASGREELSRAHVAGPAPVIDALAGGAHEVRRGPRLRSLALRLVRVADGTLDAGLASDRAHDWDIAAAHAILLGAGATLLGASGSQPRYNRTITHHEPLAAGSEPLARRLAGTMAAA